MGALDADILMALRRLGDQLDALPKAIAEAVRDELLEPADAPEPAPQGCQHPDDKRVHLGGGEWECTNRLASGRICQFRFVPAEPEVQPV